MAIIIRRDELIEELNKIKTNREIEVLDTRTGMTYSIKRINKKRKKAKETLKAISLKESK